MESVLSSKYTNKPHGSNSGSYMIYDFHTHKGEALFLLDTLNVFLNLKIFLVYYQIASHIVITFTSFQ